MAIADESGRSPAAQFLKGLGVTRDKIFQALTSVRGLGSSPTKPRRHLPGARTLGRDLTEFARKGKLDPVIGRDEEIRRVIQVLSRRTKNNPRSSANPGVGKTAIVEGSPAESCAAMPEGLKNKRIVALDMSALVAGQVSRESSKSG